MADYRERRIQPQLSWHASSLAVPYIPRTDLDNCKAGTHEYNEHTKKAGCNLHYNFSDFHWLGRSFSAWLDGLILEGIQHILPADEGPKYSVLLVQVWRGLERDVPLGAGGKVSCIHEFVLKGWHTHSY